MIDRGLRLLWGRVRKGVIRQTKGICSENGEEKEVKEKDVKV